MSYAEQAERYRDSAWRNPADMCVREQGLIFASDGRSDIAALGAAVVAGALEDIDAVLAAVASYAGYDPDGGDDALRAAVQYVWPSVAAARYPASA